MLHYYRNTPLPFFSLQRRTGGIGRVTKRAGGTGIILDCQRGHRTSGNMGEKKLKKIRTYNACIAIFFI